MIMSVIVWAIASAIFLFRFDCDVNTIVTGFYIMAGFGLIIFDKKLQRGRIKSALNNAIEYLKKSFNKENGNGKNED